MGFEIISLFEGYLLMRVISFLWKMKKERVCQAKVKFVAYRLSYRTRASINRSQLVTPLLNIEITLEGLPRSISTNF